MESKKKRNKTENKYMIYFLIGLSAVSFAAAIYINSFIDTTFDEKFYEKEFRKYTTNLETGQRMNITRHLLTYLRYDKTDNEFSSSYFNEKEKTHLLEVKSLMQKTSRIPYITAIIVIVSFALLWLLTKNRNLFIQHLSASLMAGGILIIVLFVFGFLLLLTFTNSFTTFHLLFFESNTWMLNPETDMLIRMFPETFFFDITKSIFVKSLINGVLLILVSLGLKHFTRRM